MRDFDVIDPDGNQLTFRYEIIRPSGLMSASSQTVDVCRGVALMVHHACAARAAHAWWTIKATPRHTSTVWLEADINPLGRMISYRNVSWFPSGSMTSKSRMPYSWFCGGLTT